MLSVKGHYKDGVVVPTEPINGQPESDVIITFIGTGSGNSGAPVTPESGLHLRMPEADRKDKPKVMATDYDRLTKIINENQMDAGIEDLAHQHEHYLYGTPKQ